MSIKKFPLEAYGAAVSREELVQAALDEITKNYREASLSNVARSYGVSLAYVSECVRAQTGRTYKELLQKHRMETAARLLRRSDGIILNPGGYAYYSVAILEALQLCGVPAVEVLMSEPSGREPFRNTDVVSFGCQGRFAGEGIGGYLHACSYLVQLLRLDGGAQSHMVQ